MKADNFYSDIKESIEKYFGFLEDFGFTKFDEKQLAYELHFETKNNFVSIDFSFEAIPATSINARIAPISIDVSIHGYFIDNIELKNPILEAYATELKENYDEFFEQYLKTNQNQFLDKISKQYAVNGKEINDKYLIELSDVLKRNITVLNGDFELLKANTEIIKKEYETKAAMERIENSIYTLEYQFFSNDDYDAFKEFNSINDIKQYLVDRSEIKKYRVLDCNMKEIDLTD